MVFQMIRAYISQWNPNTNNGIIYIEWLVSGVRKRKGIPVQSAEEFMAINDVLRNEKPVFFDPTSNIIRSSVEPVGDEETP